MKNILDITKKTLDNLSDKNIDATPKEYSKEFCKISKEFSLSVEECEYFNNTLSKLSQSELENNKDKKIETVYDLIDILLQRVESKNVNKMSELLQQSLKPSISLSFSDDLHAFSIKIGDSPSLIFEESIQQEMEKFIENRFEVDKKIVARKTADIARLITLMSKYLGDAIDSNKNGFSNVTNIKDEIKSISMSNSTKDELNKLQAKLVQAAITIENEMSTVNDNLSTGQNEVQKLEERVKELEAELINTKEKSSKDHLTGTLIRGAYEDEIKKLDALYKRNGQDFAIVFFDIDHFKKVNDVYGHDGGDIVLKTFASLLLKLTRDTDIIGRYGGEEFVVVLHYNNIEELDDYINRIKNVVTKNKFIYKEHKIQITFSAGVELRSKNNTAEETITNADKSLYKAKQTGRNKIVFWNGKEL
ncbi:MAG: GGDEF domain-containing protein [Campylobacterota bacterium]|nr:GGDEF domain-containing protein [Campylobacterota bacterium]